MNPKPIQEMEGVTMKSLGFLLVILCALIYLPVFNITPAHAEDIVPDSITGKWQGAGNPAIVQIQKKGSYYEGAIVEDDVNPGLVSTVIFKNLVYSAVNGVWHGKVYSVKKKKDYDVKIRMSESDKFTMTVNTVLRSKTVEWERIK
jgi:uncharacterized protein (DUF2147 family)